MSIRNRKECNGGGQSWVRAGFAVLATACGALLASGATAGDTYGPPLTKVVSYADLDLDRQTGAEALYRRIRFAARQVCGTLDNRVLSQAATWKACVEQAIERAVTDIDTPMLSAHHMAQTGKAGKPVTVASQQ